ncbi:MAG: twin-arginine translocase TatA/TatE family subunit [Sandaracinaceae bacterium]|nr:twin-arginine translocase TatA/TatE family subunit [Sandaracinaceae bacterium]
MFGLGWMEMLIIGGAISLIAGPVMLRRLVKGAQELHQMKSDLTGPRMLERLMKDDEEPEPEEEEN